MFVEVFKSQLLITIVSLDHFRKTKFLHLIATVLIKIKSLSILLLLTVDIHSYTINW